MALSVRVKVSPQTKIPSNWNDFLKNSCNKEELFALLTTYTTNTDFPSSKQIYSTSGKSVISVNSNIPMSDCTHEEADTRVVIHVLHALHNGARTIEVNTVDTDIVVILLGQFHEFLKVREEIELWIAFGSGKHFQQFRVNDLYEQLDKAVSRALPIFHAYSWCDTTSAFFRKGKKSAWQAWKSYPEATDAFLFMADNPFHAISSTSAHFKTIERLTVVLYDRTSNLTSVNEACRELFTRKNCNLDSIPPTENALLQHIKGVAFQSGIWTTCLNSQPAIPQPQEWGWCM